MAKFTKAPLKEGEVTELIPYSIDLESRVDEVVEEVNLENEIQTNEINNIRNDITIETLTLRLSSSITASTGYSSPKAFKKGPFIHLYGMVNNGRSDDTIFTLPVGYRPKLETRATAMIGSNTALMIIRTTGVVTIAGSSGSGNVSFSNISIYLED